MKTELQVSKKIEDFLSFYDEAIHKYTYYYEQVGYYDNLKNDLLHKIELGLYADRNEERRIQTQLKRCLLDRRYYKDRAEELQPFVDLFNVGDSAKTHVATINHLKNALGAVRKAEQYHESRAYKPRILADTQGD